MAVKMFRTIRTSIDKDYQHDWADGTRKVQMTVTRTGIWLGSDLDDMRARFITFTELRLLSVTPDNTSA